MGVVLPGGATVYEEKQGGRGGAGRGSKQTNDFGLHNSATSGPNHLRFFQYPWPATPSV